MREVVFAPTFDGWREAGRELLRDGVPPNEVAWVERGAEQPLLDGLAARAPAPASPGGAAGRFRVSRAFLECAPRVACYRGAGRWGLLYRVLWRLTRGEPRLMEVTVDPDVYRLTAMANAVRRDVHRMHAFVRFRRVAEGDTYVAWFRPEHLVVELASPFFARRFAPMRWSILGPDASAYWDGVRLHFGPGVPRAAAPPADALEALWRTYYAHVFNPARLRLAAMRAEMPKKYWSDLPEAVLIPALAREAPARVAAMVERSRSEAAATRGRPPRRSQPLEDRSRGGRPPQRPPTGE